MGRKREPLEPLDVHLIQQAFAVTEGGQIVRSSTGEIATFIGPGKKLLVRVYIDGKIRRVLATRIAWALASGEWPDGVVRCRNGVDDDLRAENLLVTKRGPRPFTMSIGGRASALVHRSEADRAMLAALAEHEGSLTVPQLSESVGQSAPCCCHRLAKLEKRGLVCGPHCDARRRWNLTPAGQALAAAALPVLDDTDRDILTIIVRQPAKLMALARQIGCCALTAKRRLGLMIERGLVKVANATFSITDAGISALGDGAPKRPELWVRPETVSAALSRDVHERQHHHAHDDRSAAQRSEQVTGARTRAGPSHRFGKLRDDEFDRMTG
jgi:DNA-binding IclR family transcriptional regulator